MVHSMLRAQDGHCSYYWTTRSCDELLYQFTSIETLLFGFIKICVKYDPINITGYMLTFTHMEKNKKRSI